MGLMLGLAWNAPAATCVRLVDPIAYTRPLTALDQDPVALPEDELVRRIESATQEQLGPMLREGFDQMMVEVRAYNDVRARRLAEALHARAAATWSAMSLALVSTRMGDSERATRVLREAIPLAPTAADEYGLLERLGLVLQASGDEEAARGPFGSAYARGSANAGVVLGRIALRDGQMGQARAIFRTLLHEDPPQSWALRGWGLSMLPERP